MFRDSEQKFERRSLGSIVSRTLLVPMVLLLALLGAVLFQAERLISTETDLLHSTQVLTESHLLLRLVGDMDAVLRGYLLTGNEQFLEEYRSIEPESLRRVDGLATLVQNSPEEIKVRKAREAYLGWRRYAEQMIALRRSGAKVSEPDLDLGKRQMAETRRLMREIVADREQFNAERAPRVRQAGDQLIAVCVLAGGVLFVFIVMVRRPQIVSLVEAIQKSRTQLALATEASNLGTWYWDVEANKQEWSNRCRELLGLPSDVEPSHQLFLERVHPEDRSRAEEAIEKAMKSGGSYQIDVRVIWPDGSIHWINSRGRAQIEHGRAVSMYGVAIDFSERMKVEEALQESRMRLEGIVEGAMDAIISVNERQEVVVFNKAAESIFGVPANEAIGTSIDRFIPKRFVGAHREHIRNFDRSGFTSRTMRLPSILAGLRAGGEEFPIEATISKVQLRNQRLFTAILRDITERLQAEERSRASELRFRALANTLPQLIWTSDANGNIDYVNDRWIAYTGLSLEETARTGGVGLLLPEERDSVLAAWKKALETGTEFNIEYHLRRADGEYRWFLRRAVPILVGDGVARWFGTCTDIEEMKRSQELLIRSEKLASTGRMAATVAHEINNPLAVVTNTLYLAQHDPALSEPTRSHLDLAQRELARIAHLTQQTLGFYRERSEPVIVRMSDVAQSVAEIFEGKLKQKQIDLVREFSADDQVRIVEGELRQIISNLLSNALDAAPDGSRIVLRTTWLRASNGTSPTVQLTLSDCGPGIPRELREKIFEPFFTTKLAYGTGLGLWVTRSLVLKHSGTIRVRSPHGMGAVFSVKFPAAAEQKREVVMVRRES